MLCSKETLEALQGSIRKWEEIVYNDKEERPCDCPLCLRFRILLGDCLNCPIMKKTGKKNCLGTPYEDWTSYMSESMILCLIDVKKVFDVRSKILAINELMFLRSLLEEISICEKDYIPELKPGDVIERRHTIEELQYELKKKDTRIAYLEKELRNLGEQFLVSLEKKGKSNE